MYMATYISSFSLISKINTTLTKPAVLLLLRQDHPNTQLTNEIIKLFQNNVRHPFIGRQLRRIMRELGFQHLTMRAVPVVFVDPIQSGLIDGIHTFIEQGLLNQNEMKRYVDMLHQMKKENGFTSSMTMYVLMGQRPLYGKMVELPLLRNVYKKVVDEEEMDHFEQESEIVEKEEDVKEEEEKEEKEEKEKKETTMKNVKVIKVDVPPLPVLPKVVKVVPKVDSENASGDKVLRSDMVVEKVVKKKKKTWDGEFNFFSNGGSGGVKNMKTNGIVKLPSWEE